MGVTLNTITDERITTMSGYTPTTDEVRIQWGLAVDRHRRPERLAEFDRMIAEVERAAAEKALTTEYVRQTFAYVQAGLDDDDGYPSVMHLHAEAFDAWLAERNFNFHLGHLDRHNPYRRKDNDDE